MEIKGIDGISMDQIRKEVGDGGKFVQFTYCISLILITFKRPSDIYFVRKGESAFKHGWGFFTISLILGWWGIPWGPIYTIQSMYTSFSGKNLTDVVMNELERQHIVNNPITDWNSYNQPNQPANAPVNDWNNFNQSN